MVRPVILKQLIHVGRRFCECRSHDFIPKSEDSIVVVNYSIFDEFSARSFDIPNPSLEFEIRNWLESSTSFAYLLINRDPENQQQELPHPIGRPPMERITISAATVDAFHISSFLVETLPKIEACRLIETNQFPERERFATTNLFHSTTSDAIEIYFDDELLTAS